MCCGVFLLRFVALRRVNADCGIVVAEGKDLEKRAKSSFDEAIKVYAGAEGGEEMFDEAAKEDDSD